MLVYRTGLDRWDRLQRWPLACDGACPTKLTPLYLQPGGALGFEAPTTAGFDAYVAATSGTDADWVVKLIDVYPGQVPSQEEMGGYELPVVPFTAR